MIRINFKRFFFIFLPLLLVASTLHWFIYFLYVQKETALLLNENEHHRQIRHEIILSNIDSVVSDLNILCELNEVIQLIDNGKSADILKEINQEYLAFSRNKAVYDQLRLLDSSGSEQVRVNWNKGTPLIVSPQDLQDKSNRYYFTDTIELAADKIYISPFDLNIEQGKIETPLKPVLRFGRPIIDKEGMKKGVVLLNYLGQAIIDKIEKLDTDRHLGQVMLLNKDGYWLIGPNKDDNWGFMYADRKDRTFKKKYPEAWREISENNKGMIRTDSGCFCYSTIYPLNGNLKSSIGSSLSFSPSLQGLSGKEYYWKMINYLPAKVIKEESQKHFSIFFAYFAGLCLLILGISLFLDYAINKRQKAEGEMFIAKDEAQKANAAKSIFLANMSHEIRTPMNGIIGISYLLKKTKMTIQQQEYLNKIQMSAHNLLGIINDILDVSKIEAGKLKIENISFQLEKVLNNLAKQLAFKAEEKGLELNFSFDKALPAILIGDPLRLSQILINLISNAIKFTDEGEILVKVSSKQYNSSQILVEFSVTDTGVGLTEKQVSKLFKRFTQGENNTTRKYGGTGLGLTICKQLVEMMDGDIWVESEPGKGCVFSFTIQFDSKPDAPPIHVLAPPNLSRLRVLVVDDNTNARRIIANIIHTFSFSVTTCESGLNAILELERVDKTDEPPYDIVLLDWQMPQMDGLETAKLIKEDMSLSHKPLIILITAGVAHQDPGVEASDLLDGFLLKPVTSSLLLEAIQRALGWQGDEDYQDNVIDIDDQNKISKITGATVLLVEDNEINQEVAREMLSDFNMIVTLAENGKDAITAIEKNAFDIVFMDVQMPVMDGWEATKHIRSLHHGKTVPIIALTAFAMVTQVRKCLDTGMNDHLPKPIDPNCLLDMLVKWIEPRESATKRSSFQQNLTTKESILPDKLDGIDVELGLMMVGGKQEHYLKLLHLFDKHFRNTPESLQQALANDDYPEAQRLIHNIKGTSGSIGARELSEKSQILETAINQGQQHLDSMVDEFNISVTQVLQGLKILADLPSKTLVNQDGSTSRDTKILSLHLQQMYEVLIEGDSNALDLLENVKKQLLNTGANEDVKQLSEYIEDYEFDMAVGILTKIAANLKMPLMK